MADKKFLLEIDGVRTPYEDVYEQPQFGAVGLKFGLTEQTASGDPLRGFLPGRAVACLAVWGRTPQGAIWGIDGLFEHGSWATDEATGLPVWRVWGKRLA